MAIISKRMPLFDDVYYSYSIALEENTFRFDFLYLERVGGWVFYLKDSEQNPLVLGQKLTPLTPLIVSNRVPGLSGFLYLAPKSGEDPENITGSIRNIKEFYNLYYIFDDGE